MTTWAWRAALDSLRSVLPGSTGYLLDQIAGIPSSAWARFPLDADDVALGERLLEQVGTKLGNDLFVVTDASWRPDVGPFTLPAWHLTGLLRRHGQLTGEPFFSADVVLLSPDDGVLVAVHRVGLLAVASGVPSPRPPLWPLAHLTDSTVFADRDSPLEWARPFDEIYPETEVALPSGRVLRVRWFEADEDVSVTASSGDFQVSYRGPLEDLNDAYAEFLTVVGPAEREIMRLPARP